MSFMHDNKASFNASVGEHNNIQYLDAGMAVLWDFALGITLILKPA